MFRRIEVVVRMLRDLVDTASLMIHYQDNAYFTDASEGFGVLRRLIDRYEAEYKAVPLETQ